MCAFACVRTNEINAIHENEKPCSALVVWLLFVELPFLFFTRQTTGGGTGVSHVDPHGVHAAGAAGAAAGP